MIKFETINGTLCRMVEPTPLQLDSPMPCVVRYIQGSSPMGRYLKRKYAMVINTVAKVSRIGADGRAYSSDKSFVEEVEVLEIIGYPVVDGSAEWALWQMKQGHEIINSNGTIPFCHHEGRILRCGDDISWDIDYWLRIYDDMRGWQLYEEKPQPEPPREPEYVICKRCAGSQSVPNPVVSNTAYTTCPKCGGTGYEIKPEPATFANVKVGDWVEHNSGGHHPVSKLDKSGFAIDGYEFKWFGYDGYELPDGRIRDSRILRIVPKPEVKVKVTLEGTVKPCSVNTFELCTNEGSSWIGWKELDPDTAELVKALLKAQEEQ
jgi:hypothetical protein